jgi:DNA (cytosine-5)-methyltransferase 1
MKTEHRFPYRWRLADGYPAKGIAYHGHKVFGTFICGGGSTMGYKLAGYHHLGGVEIDPRMATVYKLNHAPEHLYVEDIRAFNERTDLPAELYDLDLLDGSPPCSSFSISGEREGGWNKSKVFREGQAHQRLDDLVFTYVETIAKLRPRVALLENVKGLLSGNAKAYTKEIVRRLRALGYTVQVFLLNAASMGVPQMRERCFFIARLDAAWSNLVLSFDEVPIKYVEVREGLGQRLSEHMMRYWNNRLDTDKAFDDVAIRINGKSSLWNHKFAHPGKVLNTLVAAGSSPLIDTVEPHEVSDATLISAGTFPKDYQFLDERVQYLIGMSVPPVMTAQIAHQIHEQWLSKYPRA